MNGVGTYRDSRWRDERNFEVGAIVCEETGANAKEGRCPVHHGDACLYSSALLVTYWQERSKKLEEAIKLAHHRLLLGKLWASRHALEAAIPSLSTEKRDTAMDKEPSWYCGPREGE